MREREVMKFHYNTRPRFVLAVIGMIVIVVAIELSSLLKTTLTTIANYDVHKNKGV